MPSAAVLVIGLVLVVRRMHRGPALHRRSVCRIILCVLYLALSPTTARAERDLALVGATIYPAPEAPVISNGIVIVRDGVIAAVGARAAVSVSEKTDVLDCSGLSLTAGFWNSHVHLMPWRLFVAGWLPSFVSAGEIQAMLTRPILFGTDVGYMREYDPTDEYVYLEGAGLSFAQILATLTTAPAERFKAASRTGRILVGMDADLVVFDGDPRADIRSLARVRHVFHRGRLVYREPTRTSKSSD